MASLSIQDSELGEELRRKLEEVFDDYDIRHAYIFDNDGETCILAKFRKNSRRDGLEESIEAKLGYPMKVYDMEIFNIGMMDWDKHGVSKDVEDRIDTLYEITKTMELIYRDSLSTAGIRKRKRSVC